MKNNKNKGKALQIHVKTINMKFGTLTVYIHTFCDRKRVQTTVKIKEKTRKLKETM